MEDRMKDVVYVIKCKEMREMTERRPSKENE